MQLKKIILKGFKSFPEKTVLEFNEGVTAIVGPNGSGKSNIIEAIRWVMGEQSARILRGDRMNDVIFSGTHERKPLNLAEVELILDNSDHYLDIEYEEVSVLRRISRNGDSTYMINQQECRLRDIIDLFMDSGLGKESFSIISQGQVEAVFNSKPEDRRGIFEEAAGVYKYKVRKKDAEKKLEQTQENLDRVQDILYELEGQVEPLRKQAETAESYLEQKEKLSDLDIGVTVWQIKDLTEKVNSDQEKHQTVLTELKNVESKITELEKNQAEHKDKLAEIEDKRDYLSQELVRVVREKERAEASLNLFDEKARHREEFVAEKKASITRLDKQNEQLEKEFKDVTKDVQQKEAELTSLNKKVKELEEKRHYLEGDREAQMEELRNHYIELLQKQTSLKNEKNYLKQEINKNQTSAEKTSKVVEDLKIDIQDKQNTLETKEATYKEVSEELLSLLQEYKNVEKTLEENKETLKIRDQRLSKTSNELERAKAKYQSLKEMQENYAGYYAGVRAVMQEKEQLTGIVGTVAELIDIPTDLMTAIDTVLGSSGQFIVVEDEKSGREAINYLKQNKRGRATFLPLTTIRSRNIPTNVQNQLTQTKGFVGIASELVQYNERVKNIIENLLGQTVIANTLEAANQIARQINYRNRVVSLEGDVINAGGSMTGGGRQRNSNPVFSQKAELHSLEKFITENEKVLEQLFKNKKELESKQTTLEENVQKVRVAGEEQRFEEQRMKNEVDVLKEEVSRLERELKATSFEVSETENLHETYSTNLSEIEESLLEVNEAVKDSEEQMELLSSEQENIDEEKERLTEEIQIHFDERNEIRESLAAFRTNRQHLENQLTENKEQIADLYADIHSFDKELEIGSKEEIEELLATHGEKQTEIEEEQNKIREQFKDENKIMAEFTEQLNELSAHNKDLTDQKSKLDVQLSRNDVRIDHYLDYLAEEYKISFEEAKMLEKPTMELAEAQKEVKQLKKGIEALGPVNLNSIEEFKNVNERYQFLNQQQNDLIEAKTNLFNTMDEMDAIVEKQFKETFDRIQKQFAKVFPKMFGGGYAELMLDDPEDLLETGIEIIAQPPGKRLTRLSLLSGGERALTAISLLFSIIQVNPIPFCILDEAEAALDDANVVRFGQFLENFEDDTQFIVITHRKGTMEHSDQLYGVTMQEKGISKIVAVTLNEARQMDGVT